jgi:predicted transcriptional regulator
MNLRDIAEALNLSIKSGADQLDREVTGGYVSDMLSDVLAHAQKGNLWVTLQTHLNIVPVASMREIAGIILVNGRHPEKDTLRKADEEKVPIMGTDLHAFQVVGTLFQLGVSKGNEDI